MKMYSIVPEYQDSAQGSEEEPQKLEHPKDKDQLRASVAADVDAYLQSGKQIRQVPSLFDDRKVRPAYVPYTSGSGWGHTRVRYPKF